MLSVAITLGADTSLVVPLDSDAFNCACSRRVLDTSQPAVSCSPGVDIEEVLLAPLSWLPVWIGLLSVEVNPRFRVSFKSTS